MTEQAIINAIVGFLIALGMFLLNSLWNAVKDLQAADKSLTDRISAIDVLVAGNYVRREDMQQTVGELFRKLDRIENKLDHKVDKP